MAARQDRTTTIIISSVIGALFGATVGLMLNKRAEEHDGPAITAGEGVSLAVMALGLLRQISQLGDGE